MPGNYPTEKLYVKNAEGENIPLASVWKQAKGQLTGKIHVTEQLADLFKPGADVYVVSFPTEAFPPRPKAANKNAAPTKDVA